jgi:type II secretory pathway pseudopilin PulG
MQAFRSNIPARTARLRHGFTTLELLIAISVTLVLISLAAPLYQAQTSAVNRTAGRADATRSATFAVDAVEQDLRNTGVGVFDGQPLLVRSAIDAVSFNANMVTARVNDMVAVFYDPDADSTALGALSPGTSITLPNSSNTYPTASYVSNAETINYYVYPDTGASPIAGGQRVILARKVNRQAPEIIARNLIKTTGLPVFRYFRRNTSGVLTEVPAGSLPMFHSVPKHGTPADTGSTAVIDSISVVRISLIAMFKDAKGETVIDTVTRDVRIANQGLLQRSQCGEIPLVPGTPALNIVTLAGLPAVRLVWGASTDELAGERDVEMYAVYRRLFGATEWGEPLANVPGAGVSSLQYIDNTVDRFKRYEYATSALDCTPAPSALTPSANILVP